MGGGREGAWHASLDAAFHTILKHHAAAAFFPTPPPNPAQTDVDAAEKPSLTTTPLLMCLRHLQNYCRNNGNRLSRWVRIIFAIGDRIGRSVHLDLESRRRSRGGSTFIQLEEQ